jgi:hypothetical protein
MPEREFYSELLGVPLEAKMPPTHSIPERNIETPVSEELASLKRRVSILEARSKVSLIQLPTQEEILRYAHHH